MMIYELRTYWAAPGKEEALHQRFRTLTLRIFARYSMEVAGFWAPTPVTAESGTLVYLLAFRDHDAMIEAWDAFRADPEWQAGKEASEEGGSLVEKITSMVLQPVDYAPLRQW